MNNASFDPSLPLDDGSLLNEYSSTSTASSVKVNPIHEIQNNIRDSEVLHRHQEKESTVMQVDGSNHSLSSDKTTSFHAAYSMRDVDDQINSLKKQNFNLRLRIYFMEERLGLLQAPKDQENIYKDNIDLKVHSEELKKVIRN